MEKVSHNAIRGAKNSVPAIDWPGTGTLVLPFSFMDLLRTKTGLMDFDLPTEAQWEYLCRAGTTTYYNDGSGTVVEAQVYALGQYTNNGGMLWENEKWTTPASGCGPTNATAAVGSYLPNAWGLYDTHGNVIEWCLDWYASSLAGGEDPKGPESGSKRIWRGGCWAEGWGLSRSGARLSDPPERNLNRFGLRLVRSAIAQ